MNVLRASLAVLLLAAPAAAQGAVWVVDAAAGPGSDFTDIQPAIAAAADGDVILVRGGLYSSFTLDARSLAIVGQDGADVQVYLGTSVVRNVGPTQSVVLRGLDRIATGWFVDAPSFTDCDGPVWVEDCTFAVNNFGGSFQPDGVVVSSCDAISFVRCATLGAQVKGLGGAGLRATGSRIAAWDCQFEAHEGPIGAPPHDAGPGALLDGGFLFASGCEFVGGAGGKGFTYTVAGVTHCTDGGDGGDGLLATGAAAVFALDSSFTAGIAGNANINLGCTPGVAGEAVAAPAGALTLAAGLARSLQLPATLCAGSDATLALQGDPFSPVALAVSATPEFLFSAGLQGVLLAGAPFALFVPGSLDASGALNLAVHVPLLPAGSPEAQVLRVQPAFVGGSGHVVLGAPSMAVLVDAGSCP